jgi:hypothetical protein
MKKILILAAGFLLMLNGYSIGEINDNVGTTGVQSLKIGIGARAVGMGEVFCAIADDISTIYWNPAGLSRIGGTQVTASHMMLFQGINYEHAAVGLPLSDKISVGFGASYFIVDGLEARSADTEEHDGLFGAYDIVGTGAISMKFGMFSAGASVKYIYQSIGETLGGSESGGYAATGLAFDAGVHFASEGVEFGKGVLAGAVVQNLGNGISFNGPSGFTGAESALPMNIKLGIAYKDVENNLTVGSDVNIPSDNNVNIHLGGEYSIAKMFVLRLGFKTTTLADLGFLSGISAGAGFNLNKIQVDYAYVPYGPLDWFTHRISLLTRF